MENVIIKAAICFMYFHIAGFATTNMLRLLKGSSLSVLSSKCCCETCGEKITFFGQLPIISFIAYGGKCKYCKAKIPVMPLCLEILIFLGMSGISYLLHFTVVGVVFSFAFYELVKIALLVIYKRRTDRFWQQYILSVAMNAINFCIVAFAALLITEI